MFAVRCSAHDTDVLLGFDDIEQVVNEADHIALHWRCFCGQRGVHRLRAPGRRRGRSRC